jgi:SAM-dependent methyltransferase
VRIDGEAYHLASLAGRSARFVVCQLCGFVFQNPTLDDTELAALYQGEYRTDDPPEGYLIDQRRYAEKLCNWIEKALPDEFPARRVLDIGCGAGCFLAEFARRGWNTVGIDASDRWVSWGRNHFGLDLRVGVFGGEGMPGERFSLVILSHVIEHMSDPLPALRAIRRCLLPDGMLFVGAPNILLPPVGDRLANNFLAGPHVCLYSPRSIRRVLAKAWFHVYRQDNWSPRGLRVLAAPSNAACRTRDDAVDDWRVIDHLYRGLSRIPHAVCFAQNLVALLPKCWLVLEEIAKPVPGLPGLLRKEQGKIVNLRVPTSSGPIPLLTTDFRKDKANGATDDWVDVSEGSLVVLIGLAFGEEAMRLLPLVERRAAGLLIYEPNLSVLRTGFAVRDLTALLRSPRVRLCAGPEVTMTIGIKGWFQAATQVVWRTDPGVHEAARRTLYAPAMRTLQAWADRTRTAAASFVSEAMVA